MPDAEIRRRGGVVRIRTKSLPDDRYQTIYVVRKPGKRGGRTVGGEIHHKKGGGSTRVEPDNQPTYKIKPNTGRDQLRRIRDGRKK